MRIGAVVGLQKRLCFVGRMLTGASSICSSARSPSQNIPRRFITVHLSSELVAVDEAPVMKRPVVPPSTVSE